MRSSFITLIPYCPLGNLFPTRNLSGKALRNPTQRYGSWKFQTESDRFYRFKKLSKWTSTGMLLIKQLSKVAKFSKVIWLLWTIIFFDRLGNINKTSLWEYGYFFYSTMFTKYFNLELSHHVRRKCNFVRGRRLEWDHVILKKTFFYIINAVFNPDLSYSSFLDKLLFNKRFY